MGGSQGFESRILRCNAAVKSDRQVVVEPFMPMYARALLHLMIRV